jgi:hypothetical protein
MTYVRGCILVLQSPDVKFPFFWPFAENGESQSLQNFNSVTLIHFSAFGDVFVVNSYHRIILSACWRSLRLLIILYRVSVSFKSHESFKLLSTTQAIIIKKRFEHSRHLAPFSPYLKRNLIFTHFPFSSDILRDVRNAMRRLYKYSFYQGWRSKARFKATFQKKRRVPTPPPSGVTEPVSESLITLHV